MAEYLIQDSTLTDIADAIRAKDGSSDPILAEDMADAIAAIPSGGGGLTLLADYTATEDVSAIRIDFTEAMRGYTYYIVQLEGSVTGSVGPCMGLNTETATRYFSQLTGSYIYSAMIYVYSDARAALVGGSSTQTYNLPVEYLHIRSYNSSSVIRTGATVKIWGVAE